MGVHSCLKTLRGLVGSKFPLRNFRKFSSLFSGWLRSGVIDVDFGLCQTICLILFLCCVFEESRSLRFGSMFLESGGFLGQS